MAGRKKADPLAELAEGIAGDHALAKNGKAETADAVAAGAIEGAGAVLAAGGDANQTAAGAIGGAAAATAEVVDATTIETPPEVEADEPADTAFERRLDRLCSIVEDAKFEGGTAVGDIRDVLRDLFKTRDKPWHVLDANQRRDLDNHFTKVAQVVVRKVVQIVAEEEFETLQGTMLENFNVKGETLEVKLKLEHVDSEVLLSAYKLAGKRVVVINASDHKFGGARKPNDPGETQTEIPFADPPAVIADKPPVEHPDDDSDLADAGDEEEIEEASGDEAEQEPSADPFGNLDPEKPNFAVYDTEADVYVAAEAEDDNWTEDATKARPYTLQAAQDECIDQGEGMIVKRHVYAEPLD